MAAHLSRSSLVLSLVIAVGAGSLALGGCASSSASKGGASSPQSLATAGVVDVSRARGVTIQPAGATTAPNQPASQWVSVDLATGKTTYTDMARENHSGTLDAAWLERLRGTIAGGTWRVGTLNPPKGTTEVTQYHLQVGEAGKPGQTAQWTVPSEKPLPAAMQTFDSLIDRADRFAHPLSEKIDLLE